MSTTEQNPDHLTDALLRAGVGRDDIHVDHASGAKVSRPKLDLILRVLRVGDVMVVGLRGEPGSRRGRPADLGTGRPRHSAAVSVPSAGAASTPR